MTTALRTALERLTPESEGDLEQFVRSRRAVGASWRRISQDLHDATGVGVAYESLRAWYPDADEPTEPVAS